MMFDLGLEQENFENEVEIDKKIKEIEKRFDLVMMQDRLHESLILLKVS